MFSCGAEDVEKAAKIRSFTIHTLHEKLLT
jgi:hypothetical protein